MAFDASAENMDILKKIESRVKKFNISELLTNGLDCLRPREAIISAAGGISALRSIGRYNG